jgi:hypothetical protein
MAAVVSGRHIGIDQQAHGLLPRGNLLVTRVAFDMIGVVHVALDVAGQLDVQLVGFDCFRARRLASVSSRVPRILGSTRVARRPRLATGRALLATALARATFRRPSFRRAFLTGAGAASPPALAAPSSPAPVVVLRALFGGGRGTRGKLVVQIFELAEHIVEFGRSRKQVVVDRFAAGCRATGSGR